MHIHTERTGCPGHSLLECRFRQLSTCVVCYDDGSFVVETAAIYLDVSMFSYSDDGRVTKDVGYNRVVVSNWVCLDCIHTNTYPTHV